MNDIIDYIPQSDNEKLVSLGYTIVRTIAEGSFSKVYLAGYLYPETGGEIITKEFPRDQPTRLAVKLVERSRAPVSMMSYLDREIHVLGHVSHPHIVHVHSVLRLGDIDMIFMRHAEYGDLCNFLQTYGALKEKFARIWIRQIALALHFLHTIDVAHRDVKCENILVTANNNVKLAGFGFCNYTWNFDSDSPALSGTFCGSLPYAAPEVIKGKQPYDAKAADIWSLGVVMYAMLNKCLPFKTEKIGDLWKDQMEQNYRFLRGVESGLSPEAHLVTELLLQPNPKERLPLENLLKSKWMAMVPNLLDMSPLEKAAMKRIDRIRELLHPHKIHPGEEVGEDLNLQRDFSVCEDLMDDICEDELYPEDKVNRGTYTLFEFENLPGFEIDRRSKDHLEVANVKK